MSYHGLLPLCKGFLDSLHKDASPKVLEVGVDRGVSFITLTTFLARTRESFASIGVDIKIQEQVQIMLANLDLQASQQSYLIEDNSLTVLPKMIEQNMKFDLVLLDGDHNYHTVSKEMSLLSSLVTENSLIVIDDYDGRWSNRDLWYAERPDYETVSVATKPVSTDKTGVQPAVDEWLEKNSSWKKFKLTSGEPIVLASGEIAANFAKRLAGGQ